ncbi:hypothetical protein FRC08_004112 [Ceratobasidium sp. 394]|nr:hypothetical protein FRC08_004112 [Ceratobasidium sp. 394]
MNAWLPRWRITTRQGSALQLKTCFQHRPRQPSYTFPVISLARFLDFSCGLVSCNISSWPTHVLPLALQVRTRPIRGRGHHYDYQRQILETGHESTGQECVTKN